MSRMFMPMAFYYFSVFKYAHEMNDLLKPFGVHFSHPQNVEPVWFSARKTMYIA